MPQSISDNRPEILFSENQKFSALWVILIIACSAAGVAIPILFQFRSGSRIASPLTISNLLPLVIIAALILLFYFTELRVRVLPDAILFKFHPFHLKWRRINAQEIVSCASVTYRPIRDYGGWGIRYRPDNGTAYNVSGNRGVRIEKKDEKKVLFGSGRPDEFAAAVRTIIEQQQCTRHS